MCAFFLSHPPPHFENIGPTISSWACGRCPFPTPALHITGCGHTWKLWKLEPRGAELMFPSQGVGVRSLSGPGGRLLLWPQETQPGSPSGSPFPLCGFHRSPLSSRPLEVVSLGDLSPGRSDGFGLSLLSPSQPQGVR